MKRCNKCTLPEAYPGIVLDKNGVCNYCLHFDMYKDREAAITLELRKHFSETISKVKKRSKKNKFDCIVAYSGGKDSTFLLHYLKENYNLKILAHVLDNGFISPRAFKNIDHITKSLGIECRITHPPLETLKKIFKYTLLEKVSYPKELLSMMSPLCSACQGIVFGTTLKMAMEKDIPLMFIGYTPGQYPAISLENYLKVNSCIYLSHHVYKDDPMDMIKIIKDPINKKFGEEVDPFFFDSQYLKGKSKPPHVLFPFHMTVDYDEKHIYREIKKLGWIKPEDTDPCSSNCIINALANYACNKEYKYHPYVGELSFLVRKGQLSYEEALSMQEIDENSFAMQYSLKELGLKKEDIKA